MLNVTASLVVRARDSLEAGLAGDGAAVEVALEVRGEELARVVGSDLREHVVLGDLDVLGRDAGELGDLGGLLLEDGLEVLDVDLLARVGRLAVVVPLPELDTSDLSGSGAVNVSNVFG